MKVNEVSLADLRPGQLIVLTSRMRRYEVTLTKAQEQGPSTTVVIVYAADPASPVIVSADNHIVAGGSWRYGDMTVDPVSTINVL